MTLGDVVLERGPGRLLRAAGRALEDLPVADLRTLYKEAGFLVFQGFRVTAAQFHLFGKRFMDRVKTTPEEQRRQHPLHRGLQTVVSGLHAMNFHADFGQLPGRPDVISFWCQVPPASAGETFVCDGIELWEHLDEATRQRFLSRRIRQSSRVDRRLWATFAGTDDFDTVKANLEKDEGVACTLNADGSLQVNWTTWAAFKPRFADRLTLASNLFPGLYLGLVTTWDDGQPLEPALINGLTARCRELSTVIRWEAGDFAIVDNSRYLHARAMQDAQRKLFTLQGYIKF